MRFCVVLWVLTCSTLGWAQADQSLSVSVPRLFFYTYEFSYEFSYSADLTRKMVLTPIVQYGRFNKLGQYNEFDFTNDQMDFKKGLGLRVGHKFYLKKADRIDEIHYPYLSIELEYTRTHIDYSGSFELGNQTFREDQRLRFHNWGSRLLIGDQVVKNNHLVIDFFFGIDWTRLNFIQNPQGNVSRQYDAFVFGPTRQGLRPCLGLKIGVSL